MTEIIVVATGLGALAYAVWRRRSGRRQTAARTFAEAIPASVSLQPEPILRDDELLLYNVMRLAVEERFLVLVRVPLLSFLKVEGKGPERIQVLRHLALKHLDFALVHPGARLVEQAVLVEGPTGDPRDKSRTREIRTIMQAAGIRLSTLKAGTSYTVQQLAEMFEVAEPE